MGSWDLTSQKGLSLWGDPMDSIWDAAAPKIHFGTSSHLKICTHPKSWVWHGQRVLGIQARPGFGESE